MSDALYYKGYQPKAKPELDKEETELHVNRERIRKEKAHAVVCPPFGTPAIITTIILGIIVVILIGVLIWYIITKKAPFTSTKPLNGACNTDRDCNTNLVCSGGQCRQAPLTGCTLSSQCSVGYTCASNECLGTIGAVCTSSSQCASAFQCISNRCA
jgi:hypothetical protein